MLITPLKKRPQRKNKTQTETGMLFHHKELRSREACEKNSVE